MIGLGINHGIGLGQQSGGAAAFTPLSLSPNAWYDPSDLATMFQSGTRAAPGTAVAASGDPVGLWLDKSGNNLDLSQATAAAKPLFNIAAGVRSVIFDGVDDYLQSAGIGTLAVGNNPVTLAAIAKQVTAGNFPQLLTYGRNAAGKSRGLATSAAAGVVGVSWNSDDQNTASAWNVVRDIVADFTQPANDRASVYVDNAAVQTINAAAAYTLDGANTIIVGVSPGFAGPGNFQVYDMVLRNGAFTAGERTSYRDYRLAKGI